MGNIRKPKPFRGRSVKQKQISTLKKLALAFVIVVFAALVYMNLASKTNEAQQRVELQKTLHQLQSMKQTLDSRKASSLKEQAEKEKQIQELNNQLQEANKALQAKRAANIAYAASVPAPEPADSAKAFIYEHESGNVACKINGGLIDCNYDGDRACGIGQALPCQKLTKDCALSDYACQDRWFTNYMVSRYGTWQNAKAFWLNNHWW